ncbi:TonB-dependent receptor plug domain-containing protein [Lysobacter tyrosinilyticus]
MNRKLLAAAVCAALVSPVAWAQDADTPQEKKSATDIDAVVVTGSLIPQVQVENANPVIQITSEDIDRQGFRNVYEVLRAQPLATGAVQDNQFSGGFTTGATTISLLGLSPGFTLILMDGRPLADYPLLYNGQSNFVDLSTIPTGMVERIDILPGNQSSIYGSAAIAGVVNIILKKKFDGNELSIRAGGYSQGGGENQRLQFIGGTSWDKLNLVYGVQLGRQDPIYAADRDDFNSTNDNPNPNARYGSRAVLHLTFPSTYIDPGQAACDGMSNLFGGTMIRDNRPGRGFYCGSREEPGYTTILNKDESATGYLNATYAVTDDDELYASLLYNYDHTSFNGGNRFWETSIGTDGFFVNANTAGPGSQTAFGNFELFQKIFAPEETGRHTNDEHVISHSYNAAFGARGGIGDSNWDYDVYYARSEYHLKDRQLWALKDKVDGFFEDMFLGPKLGDYYGYPIYAPTDANFYRAITPDEYMSFQGLIQSKSKTWTHTVNATFTNGNLFELPAGPVGVALLLQGGYQSWENPTDPRVINNEFWGLTGTSGAGKRWNKALGVEFRVPLTKMLTADFSSRYDRYGNVGASGDSKATTKVGFEFRPFDSLLLRANWATAFRAPDMAYIFAGPSGFFSSATDYYRCATQEPGVPIEDCSFTGSQYFGERQGNRDLKSITAESWGYGAVWSPNSNFNLHADYYDVKIENEVSDLNVDQLLQDESACRLGVLSITSPTCVDALARITRSTLSGGISTIAINPINISKERVKGVTAGADYRLETAGLGTFGFGVNYNRTLDHTYQQFPGDPNFDLLDSPYLSSEFEQVLSANVDWEIGRFSTTLYGVWYPATYDFDAQNDPTNGTKSKVSSYELFNGSVKYRFTDDMSVSLIVNNIADKGAPKDDSWTSYPYYNSFNYNGYGRSFWLEFDWRFGQKKK